MFFGHIPLGYVGQLGLANEDVGVERYQGAWNDAQQDIKVKQVLETIPLEIRWLHEHLMLMAAGTRWHCSTQKLNELMSFSKVE